MSLTDDDAVLVRKHLREFEGYVPYVYQDTLGYWTLGYGRCVDQRVGGGISVEEADILLTNDMERCDQDLQGFGWFKTLAGPRKVAILSMRYQLGAEGFREFKQMLAHIADGNWALAAVEALDSRWAKQTPKRAQAVAAMLEQEAYP